MGRNGSGSSTRRRNAATLAALAVLLVVATTAYALLPGLFAEDDETVEAVSLIGATAEQIEAIEWEGTAGSGSIQRAASDAGGADDASVSAEDGSADPSDSADSEGASSWVVAGDTEGIGLDGDLCDALASALADATVSRTIPAEDVTADMGLDDPDVTVEVTLEDGSTLSLALNDPTDGGSTCYARTTTDDDSDAYVLSGSLAQTFAIAIGDLYATEASPSAYDIVDVTVESAEGTLSLTYREGGDDTLSYTSQYEWFAAWDGGTPVAASASAATAFADIVNYVSWESRVDPAYDGTVDYGLDAPTLTATLNYTKSTSENMGDTDGDGDDDYETVTTPGTFILVVGSQAEDGSYYAQPMGSTKVYTVSADDVAELLETRVEDLLPNDVCLMDWDTVESVDITVDGTTTSIELVRDDSSSEDAESESDDGGTSDDGDTSDGGTDSDAASDGDDADTDDAHADSYLVNGEEADGDAVESLLDAIDALTSEDSTEGGASEGASAEVTLVFHRNTESFTTVTLSFTRYSTSFYLADLDGDARLLVNKNDVAHLKDLVSEL